VGHPNPYTLCEKALKASLRILHFHSVYTANGNLSLKEEGSWAVSSSLQAMKAYRMESLTKSARAETIEKSVPTNVGLWRSLGARFHGMEEVVGSIPTRSTIKSTTYSNSFLRFGSIW
jgi:hypothetical protein